MELLHKELTDGILKTFYDVYNELGFGFAEKVYQNSMYLELRARGFKVDAQVKIDVFYKDTNVGEFKADLIINGLVILELKAAEAIVPEFEAQLLNYLRATDKEVGFVLNFGPRPVAIRRVFENSRKKIGIQKTA